MILKRLLDLFLSSLGLIVLTPIFLLILLAIKLDSKGPTIFKQTRVGLNGKEFKIYKFRTMHFAQGNSGMQITVEGDKRITRTGKVLRKYKLDELPQLYNIISGDMSLVGPRPEVPKYVEFYPENIKNIVLSVRPGVTDPASLAYINENEVLAASDDPEKEYIQTILPEKLDLYVNYIENQSFVQDINLILKTIAKIMLKNT